MQQKSDLSIVFNSAAMGVAIKAAALIGAGLAAQASPMLAVPATILATKIMDMSLGSKPVRSR